MRDDKILITAKLNYSLDIFVLYLKKRKVLFICIY